MECRCCTERSIEDLLNIIIQQSINSSQFRVFKFKGGAILAVASIVLGKDGRLRMLRIRSREEHIQMLGN
jgi:hypothetical protein